MQMSGKLATHKVSGPPMLEPFWFRRVRVGKHRTTVEDEGRLVVEGVGMRLQSVSLAVGTEVMLWLSAEGYFVCATLDEIAKADEERKAAMGLEDEARRMRLNVWRRNSEKFNAAIKLPVAWEVGIKDVLSGLGQNSVGDGRSRATVEHVYLREPLSCGRLVRKTGDFLCSTSQTANGKRWSGTIVERSYDGDGEPYQPRVTCKACITIAERLSRG